MIPRNILKFPRRVQDKVKESEEPGEKLNG
jgi:hypothetical protein